MSSINDAFEALYNEERKVNHKFTMSQLCQLLIVYLDAFKPISFKDISVYLDCKCTNRSGLNTKKSKSKSNTSMLLNYDDADSGITNESHPRETQPCAVKYVLALDKANSSAYMWRTNDLTHNHTLEACRTKCRLDEVKIGPHGLPNSIINSSSLHVSAAGLGGANAGALTLGRGLGSSADPLFDFGGGSGTKSSAQIQLDHALFGTSTSSAAGGSASNVLIVGDSGVGGGSTKVTKLEISSSDPDVKPRGRGRPRKPSNVIPMLNEEERELVIPVFRQILLNPGEFPSASVKDVLKIIKLGKRVAERKEKENKE
ncbi:unnamed protein product [Ambrosiozyma monospora]|uniref:Unnamed protein product n=1 Tax=Ambrosiozyma monospora TaxID=43982 RepID=A0ACB5TR94_AMBMO|nr:unnamed protein product [Ambrosiozyma monospora]